MELKSLSLGRALWRPLGIAGIVGGALIISGAAPLLTATGRNAAATPAANTTVGAPAPVGAAPISYADVVARATPAVVTVQIERKAQPTAATNGLEDDPFFQQFFGRGQGNQGSQGGRGFRMNPPEAIEHGLGSGVIVSQDGNILTNNHVVDSADTVRVTLSDGREFSAKVVGTDKATDLAVVHINAKNLPTLPLGDSDRVRVGDVVLAIGNPLGVGQTVTMGIISAKGRTTDVGDGAYEDFLQTDAPINQGNSGGALITSAGELVGINSQMLSNSGGSIGIGFAIPSDMAKNVMDQLVENGHVRRAILGITVQPLTSDLASSLGLNSTHGALVSSVDDGGPAAKAGLHQGDVILKVGGAQVEDSNQLRNRVSSQAPGSTVVLDIQRNGTPQQVTVHLGELTDKPATAPAASQPDSHDATLSALGMSTTPLTPELAQQFQLPRGAQGLAVTKVDPSGAAARVGIRAGDVIRDVEGRAVRTSSDLRDALTRRGDRPALAYVQRADSGFYVALPRS